jgi:protein-disulfide isomerase/uncharacterized membrane protein
MEKSRQYSWFAAFISALVAVGLHSYLAFKFYALRFGALGQSSICNLNETWNCDAVSASSYAQFLGNPMAVWGLATNLIFALVLLFARMGWFEDEERGQRYSAWLACLIFLSSVVMGTISLTQLKSLCLFCVIAYALSLISVAGTLIWARPSIISHLGSDVSALFTNSKGMLVALIAIPASAFFINSIFIDNFQMSKMGLVADEKIAQWTGAKEQVLDSSKGLILFRGTGQPKMEIIEFADFLCPHCKEAFFGLDAFTSSHPDVKLTFKYFPLDGGCNPDTHMSGSGNGVRCEAAYYTQCAEKLYQKGWAVHHYLFENQDRLHGLSSRDDVGDMVCKDLNLDCTALKTCATSPETRDEVMALAAEGINSGVQGTPTIYVNKRMLPYGQFLPILEKAYENLKTH